MDGSRLEEDRVDGAALHRGGEEARLVWAGGFDVIGADCNSSRYGSGWGVGDKVGGPL